MRLGEIHCDLFTVRDRMDVPIHYVIVLLCLCLSVVSVTGAKTKRRVSRTACVFMWNYECYLGNEKTGKGDNDMITKRCVSLFTCM